MKTKRITSGLLLIVGIAIVIGLTIKYRDDDWDGDMGNRRERELPYQRIAYKRLGEEIAKRHPRAKILLIRYRSLPLEGGEVNQTEEAQMKGFKEGLNGKAEILVVKEVSSGMEDMMDSDDPDATKESAEKLKKEMFTADMFDKLVAENKACNVVVSFVGLPPDYKLMTFWEIKDPKKRPALVVAHAYLYDMKFAFDPKQRFIAAALAHRAVPFDPTKPVPEDEQVVFDSRYLMVTPDNVDQIDKENPDFFRPEKKGK